MIKQKKIYEDIDPKDEIINTTTGEVITSQNINAKLVRVNAMEYYDIDYYNYASLNLHSIKVINKLASAGKVRWVDLSYLFMMCQVMDKYCTLRSKNGKVYSRMELSNTLMISYKTLNRAINNLIKAKLLAEGPISFLKVKQKVLIIHPDIMKRQRELHSDIIEKFHIDLLK